MGLEERIIEITFLLTSILVSNSSLRHFLSDLKHWYKGLNVIMI